MIALLVLCFTATVGNTNEKTLLIRLQIMLIVKLQKLKNIKLRFGQIKKLRMLKCGLN